MKEVQDKLKKFLKEKTGHSVNDPKLNLIKTGILDSFTMIELINYIESTFNISIDMEKLNQNNFNSLNTISQTIKKWQK